MTGAGRIVEFQATAEGLPFTRDEMQAMLALGERGVQQLIAYQRTVLADVLQTTPKL
jgi:ribonuclease PH